MMRLKSRFKVKFLPLKLKGGLARFGMILTLLRGKLHLRGQKAYASIAVNNILQRL
ncbi:hypothetical protein DITRI_Ditri06bG0159200 [Diplodiscus trichospermus]